jgi:hypothetical protein
MKYRAAAAEILAGGWQGSSRKSHPIDGGDPGEGGKVAETDLLFAISGNWHKSCYWLQAR